MKLWERFTKEEIFQLAEESTLRKELCMKLGYCDYDSRVIKALLKKYPDLDLSHMTEGQLIDMSGKRFGRLLVLDYVGSKSRRSLWRCKCDCGKETIVQGSNLRQGDTTSCGCLWHEKFTKSSFQDLTGQHFGELIVISRDETRPQGHQLPVYWTCECSCGKRISVLAENLRSGNSQSCGCKRISHGENKIQEILKEEGIPFIKEYKFSDLKDKRPLSFDFIIFKDEKPKYAIEFQGIQHFQSIEIFGGEETFMQQQKRDNMKREYCRNNDILLIECNYNDTDKEIREKLSVIKI